jgi:hypothetical protein
MGLVAKYGDLEFRRVAQDLFDACHSGHSISHDDELLHYRTSPR